MTLPKCQCTADKYHLFDICTLIFAVLKASFAQWLTSITSVRLSLCKVERLGLLFEQQGLKLTQIHHEIIESLINGTDKPAANRRTHLQKNSKY